MEHPDSNEAEDEIIARALADITESPTAIERQIAAASALRYSDENYAHYNTSRSHPYRFGAIVFFILFLLIIAAAIFVFTDIGRPLQNAVSGMLQIEQAAAPKNPLPVSPSPAANTSQSTIIPQPANAPSPTNTAEKAALKNNSDVAMPNALSIPIIDVSLRNRPELLEQLVQVYRSQLSIDPNDAAAQTALNQLQERSLSELETIVAGEDETAAIRSLELFSRLFPDLAENTRYKYLVARVDHMHRDAKTESPIETESPNTSSSSTASTTVAPPTPTVSPTAPTATAPAVAAISKKTVSSITDASTSAVKKASENALSSKPDVRVLSITPGTLVDQRFVPSDEGKVFMVEISYRNFKNSAESSEPTLIARLGVPGESMVLAETPVDILGDRGTKSFLMEAMVSGNTGETYKLNFILDGEFLASRTIRLSSPP